ncbi:unnamed protein product [Closterium sp. NIES-53]
MSDSSALPSAFTLPCPAARSPYSPRAACEQLVQPARRPRTTRTARSPCAPALHSTGDPRAAHTLPCARPACAPCRTAAVACCCRHCCWPLPLLLLAAATAALPARADQRCLSPLGRRQRCPANPQLLPVAAAAAVGHCRCCYWPLPLLPCLHALLSAGLPCLAATGSALPIRSCCLLLPPLLLATAADATGRCHCCPACMCCSALPCLPGRHQRCPANPQLLPTAAATAAGHYCCCFWPPPLLPCLLALLSAALPCLVAASAALPIRSCCLTLAHRLLPCALHCSRRLRAPCLSRPRIALCRPLMPLPCPCCIAALPARALTCPTCAPAVVTSSLSLQQLREWAICIVSGLSGGVLILEVPVSLLLLVVPLVDAEVLGVDSSSSSIRWRLSPRSSFVSGLSGGAAPMAEGFGTQARLAASSAPAPQSHRSKPLSLSHRPTLPEGPVVARGATVLPCPAASSGLLIGLHLPSFAKNLVATSVLQDQWVTITQPGGELMAICTDSCIDEHLATFTWRPGSGLYRLTTDSALVADSGQVAALVEVASSCSCRLLMHQNLRWHHRLGHPSLPRLGGMHSCLLISGLPRSLPLLLRSLAPPCIPCIEGRQRVAPHSSFPPTTAPLQTLHMDVWGLARVPGQSGEH